MEQAENPVKSRQTLISYVVIITVIILLFVGLIFYLNIIYDRKGKKHIGVHYYDNLTGIWKFINNVIKGEPNSICIDKRKECNMHIDGTLYEDTDTYYELTRSYLKIWYGNKEHHIDLSKIKAFKLKDGTTSIFTRFKVSRLEKQKPIKYAFVCGSIDNQLFIMYHSGPLGLYYEDKFIVVFPYSSPTLASELSHSQSIVGSMKRDANLILAKMKAEDLKLIRFPRWGTKSVTSPSSSVPTADAPKQPM